MNRSITLSLASATALAAQLALGACSKHEPVSTDAGATAPSMSASAPDAMAASAAPMDSISSASAVAGADAAASAAAQAASDASMAASR